MQMKLGSWKWEQKKSADWRGGEAYVILHFFNPLAHQVSTVLSGATVLCNTGILDIRLVFREHILPATAHNHLPLNTKRNLIVHCTKSSFPDVILQLFREVDVVTSVFFRDNGKIRTILTFASVGYRFWFWLLFLFESLVDYQ